MDICGCGIGGFGPYCFQNKTKLMPEKSMSRDHIFLPLFVKQPLKLIMYHSDDFPMTDGNGFVNMKNSNNKKNVSGSIKGPLRFKTNGKLFYQFRKCSWSKCYDNELNQHSLATIHSW